MAAITNDASETPKENNHPAKRRKIEYGGEKQSTRHVLLDGKVVKINIDSNGDFLPQEHHLPHVGAVKSEPSNQIQTLLPDWPVLSTVAPEKWRRQVRLCPLQ